MSMNGVKNSYQRCIIYRHRKGLAGAPLSHQRGEASIRSYYSSLLLVSDESGGLFLSLKRSLRTLSCTVL
jgi:hypothetical protein